MFAGAETIKLCSDARDWYPFTYEEDSQAKGMHVDIVIHALRHGGHEYEIFPYPRRRCIHYVRRGKMDGMISIAYDPVLAEFFDYPPGAQTEGVSDWRIMQVDHVVVTPASTAYEFTGDIRSIPEPVRVPAGETIMAPLRTAGLKIVEVQTDRQTFSMLIRDETGSLITTSIIAETMNEDPKYHGKFTIQPAPLTSQSYFLAFSKRSPLSQEVRQQIWEEIVTWRKDYVYMLQLFALY